MFYDLRESLYRDFGYYRTNGYSRLETSWNVLSGAAIFIFGLLICRFWGHSWVNMNDDPDYPNIWVECRRCGCGLGQPWH